MLLHQFQIQNESLWTSRPVQMPEGIRRLIIANLKSFLQVTYIYVVLCSFYYLRFFKAWHVGLKHAKTALGFILIRINSK